MAVQKNNMVMYGTSGSFSRLITFKNYNKRTVIAHYPDMSKVIYTTAQLAERFRFKMAVAYARAAIADPVKKKLYGARKHFSAYHAAIADYINTSKAEEKQETEKQEKETSGIKAKIIGKTVSPAPSIVPDNPAAGFEGSPPVN